MWAKLDDTAHSHPKLLAAIGTRPIAPLELWTLAMSYGSAYATGGQIPSSWVARFKGGAKAAAKLVEVGLWHDAPEGWAFHDWEDYQPSPDEIEKKREQSRRRQRERRERLAEHRGAK